MLKDLMTYKNICQKNHCYWWYKYIFIE
jgi:hypothetical protein